MSETKRAESGTPDVSAHRELSFDEERALEAGKKRWLPRIFQSYGTPITDLMASPLKTGLIYGAPAGLIGAGLGSAVGGAMTNKNHSTLGALIGGLGVGGLAAIAAGMDREAKNEGLEELMRRMPEGAAKRDLLADPQYQADFLGWDNNKIVATARARYYRPTERFSKRTEDMAAARARYNERQKQSDFNKDVSMPTTEKKALNTTTGLMGAAGGALAGAPLGGIAGGLYGALTAEKGKRLERALRLAGRGALTGGAIGGGAGLGAGLMMPEGMGTLLGTIPAHLKLMNDPAGYALRAGAGGIGGGALGAYLSGGSEDDAKKKDDSEENEDKKETRKAAQAILDNNTLSLAEKLAAYSALLKQAEGDLPMPTPLPRVSPITPDMLEPATMKVNPFPAGPVAGRFPSRDSARLAESIVESKLPPRPNIDLGTPFAKKEPDFPIIRDGAEKGSPELRDALDELAGKPLTGDRAMRQIARQFREENAARLAKRDTDARAARAAKSNRAMSIEGVKQFFGVSKEQQPGASVWSHIAKPFTSDKKEAPKTEPKAEPGMLDKLKPYAEKLKPYAPYAAGGAAALGTAALAYHLMNRKKKKKNPEQDSEEEYAMPKAANVNWYTLAQQKQSNALIPLARGAAAIAPQVIKIPGAASAASKIPSWLAPAAGTAGGAGGLYGLSRLWGGKDPSMLQQLQQKMQQVMDYKYTPHIAAGVGAAGLLGGAAYMGSNAGKNEAKKKKKKPQEKRSFSPHQATMQTGESGQAHPLNAINAADETIPHFAKAHAAGNYQAAEGYNKQYMSLMQSASDANKQIGGPAIQARPLTQTWPLPAQTAGAKAPMVKTQSAREFGEKVSLDLGNIGMGAGAGAGLGGLAGGLYGALAPGYEEDPTSGRRRRRSRLMAALRGALGGAAVGGLGGAAAGHFGGHLFPEMKDKLDQAKTEATRAYNSVAPRALRSQSANADMDALSAAGEEPMAPTDNAYGNAAYEAAQNAQWTPPRTATPTPPVGMGGATMAAPAGFNQFRQQ